MSANDAGIFDHCRLQLGLVTLDQLHQLGLSHDQIARQVQQGSLVRANTKVFRHAVVDPTWEQRVLAAVLAAGPHALVARRSAARLSGLAGARTDRVEIVVARWSRRAQVDAQLIESTDLRPMDLAEARRGRPGVKFTRALLEARLGVELGSNDFERQNLLVLAGWFPLRFSWRTVKDQPALSGGR